MARFLLASSPLTKLLKTLIGGRPGPWALISAWKSDRKDEKENWAAQEALKVDLLRKFTPEEVEGGYKSDPEPTFFVYGIDEMEAIELANKYKQESVMVGSGGKYRLIQTSDITDKDTGDVSLAPQEWLRGDARRDLHVLSPGENKFIDEQVDLPPGERSKEWPIPSFTEPKKTKGPRRKGIPGKERSRITLQDPSTLPPPSVAKWIRGVCKFA